GAATLGALGFAGVAGGAAPPVWITDAPDIVNVTVLDSATDATVGTVGPLVTDGSSKPAISPDGTYAYLPQILNGAVLRIDTGTLQFSLNVTGFHCPDHVALTPDGSRIYVGSGCNDTNEVRVIDASTYT